MMKSDFKPPNIVSCHLFSNADYNSQSPPGSCHNVSNTSEIAENAILPSDQNHPTHRKIIRDDCDIHKWQMYHGQNHPNEKSHNEQRLLISHQESLTTTNTNHASNSSVSSSSGTTSHGYHQTNPSPNLQPPQTALPSTSPHSLLIPDTLLRANINSQQIVPNTLTQDGRQEHVMDSYSCFHDSDVSKSESIGSVTVIANIGTKGCESRGQTSNFEQIQQVQQVQTDASNVEFDYNVDGGEGSSCVSDSVKQYRSPNQPSVPKGRILVWLIDSWPTNYRRQSPQCYIAN